MATSSRPGPSLTLHEQAALANAPKQKSLEARAKRWWDLPAKTQVTRQIGDRMLAVFPPDVYADDAGDALRHGEWQRQSARAVGPTYANAAGLAHEADALVDSFRVHVLGQEPHLRSTVPTVGQVIPRIRMDLHNNAEGRRAAAEGRPVDMSRLQTYPRALAWWPRFGAGPAAIPQRRHQTARR